MRLKTFSVSELNGYIKRLLSTDPILGAVKVKGELSSFKAHNSGHAYFTLKDAQSRLQCVMFSSHFQRLDFEPKEGDKVELFGRISVYEKSGQYQLYVTEMLPDGMGDLYLQFMQLKNRLEKEGLFDQDIKRPIETFPQKIAVITSPTGAAVRDVISVLKRRNPLLDVLVIPASVQGDRTVDEVLTAFDALEGRKDIQTVILTRGGGSYEELFNFNDERIARKIRASKIPVISAIGHEVDFTISDFVADLRAPTPSAAAELATGDLLTRINRSKELMQRLAKGIELKIDRRRSSIERFSPDRMIFPIEKRLVDLAHRSDALSSQITQSANQKLNAAAHEFHLLEERLRARNPMTLIEKGYTRLTDSNGRPVSSINAVQEGDILISELKDGRLKSVVSDKEVRHG